MVTKRELGHALVFCDQWDEPDACFIDEVEQRECVMDRGFLFVGFVVFNNDGCDHGLDGHG